MKTNSYTGAGILTILNFKRDRLRLLIWISGITLMVLFLTTTFKSILTTDEALRSMIMMFSGNPALRAFLAPASGVSLGGFIMLRTSTVIAVVIALFNVQTIVRHTRQNEETGCEEMIGSTVIGRHASLLAALLITVSANILLMVLIAIVFIINDLPVDGSFAAGVALGATGIAFAGITAITAQLSETSRGASGIAGITMGGMFLLSSIGNMLGKVKAGGVEVESAWPAWLSPFGWYQQIHSFHQNNWWILLMFAAFFAVSVGIAFSLNSRRDVGMGMIPAGRGRANASPGLLSPLGFAWRLQQNMFVVWAITIAIFAVVFGAASGEFSEAISGVDRADEIFGRVFDMSEVFFRIIISILGSFVAIYTIQALMRMASEEANGLLDAFLATAVTRLKWIVSHIALILPGTVCLLVLMGLSGGISASGEEEIRLLKVLESALLQIPAIFVLAGLSIMVFGFFPRWSGTVSWAAVTFSIVAGPFLGPALDLPEWVQNISPFTYIPSPTEEITARPIIVLLTIAIVFVLVGLAAFCRRSLDAWKV